MCRVAVTRDGDTKRAAPHSCVTSPGLVHVHPQGMEFPVAPQVSSAAPNIPNLPPAGAELCPSSTSFSSQTCREQGEFSGKLQTSTKDPEPALPAEDTGSRQRALLPLGEFSSHHRIHWESRVAQSPSQSCPMAQIPPRWIWSRGEQAAPEDSRATITVIRNGGSGLADPAGILSCFMGGQIARDVQGPLLCPILSSGMCWHTQSSAQPHSHLPLGDAAPGKQLGPPLLPPTPLLFRNSPQWQLRGHL